MKDPLIRKCSPYEILNLAITATPGEARQAMLEGGGQKTHSKQARQKAYQSLTRPVDRIKVDVFEYPVNEQSFSDFNVEIPDPDCEHLEKLRGYPSLSLDSFLPFSLEEDLGTVDLGKPPEVMIDFARLEIKFDIQDIKPPVSFYP